MGQLIEGLQKGGLRDKTEAEKTLQNVEKTTATFCALTTIGPNIINARDAVSVVATDAMQGINQVKAVAKAGMSVGSSIKAYKDEMETIDRNSEGRDGEGRDKHERKITEGWT